MDHQETVRALAALSQEHRLQIFRLLVRAGPEGLAAGIIAERLGIPGSSLSFHLAQLSQSGLVTQQRQSRSVIYSACFAKMNALMTYLTDNCCEGADCGLASDVSRSARGKGA